MYRILVIFAVLAASSAQVLLKVGASKDYYPFWRRYINPWVILGYFVLFCSLLINIFCMGHGVQAKEISVIESFSYMFVPGLSWLCFKDQITKRKVAAIILILIGVIVFFYGT